MIRQRFLHRKVDRQGQSIVELALCLPFLMLLMLGTIDVGRVFFDYIELRNAVVEGATYGTRHPADVGGIAGAVSEHSIPASTIISSYTTGVCDQPQGGGSITVAATHTFTPIFFGTLSSFFPDVDWSFDVHAESTMRCMT